MATSHATIKTALEVLYEDAKTNKITEEEMADGMATIIQDAIQSATIGPGTFNVTTAPGNVLGLGAIS